MNLGQERKHLFHGTPIGEWTLAVLLFLPAVGCGSHHYDRLRTEDEIPKLRTLKDSYTSIPSRTLLVPAGRANGDTLHLAIREMGTGCRDRVIFFIHGLLSDSNTWRFLAGDLGTDHDLLLVDLPGCGQSDKPHPDLMGPDGYSPTAQARRVLLALRHVLAFRKESTRVTLIAQSFGGMVALRMLGEEDLRREFGDVLSRIDHAALIAPGDFAIEKVYPAFKQIAELTDIEVFLGDLLGLAHSRAARFARFCAVEQEAIVPREEADKLYRILTTAETRYAAQAVIRQAVPFTEDERPDWRAIEDLVADYANIDIPCLILWGVRDETFPLSMGYKLQEEIPNARLCVVERSMHTLQRERPRLCASFIREFMKTSGDGWPPIRLVGPRASGRVVLQ